MKQLGRVKLVLAAVLCAVQLFAVEIRVDFAKDVRPVKPMHAVGQPPILGVRSFKLFHHLKEAGVPYSRLHDVGVYRPHMVDIPNIFWNFDADENDPASYDFYYTDRLLEAHPLTDWNWDGQFEDIQPRPPYANPTKHNAVDAMFEILRRFPRDKARLEQCRRILRFCERRFVCWEKPANHPQWDVPSVLEQYSCFIPIDASAAKMIRAYLALWRVTGEPELLAKARTLGDTITRVQTPEGRIPTFWTHDTLGQPIYDWLNCMGSSAAALLELDDATNAR